MKTRAGGSTTRILTLTAAAAAVALAVTTAPLGGAVRQDKACSCDNLSACVNAKDEKPPAEKPPKKKDPVKPTEFRMRGLVLKFNPKVGDKDLPGLDEGTGTAEDTEHNFTLGRASTSGHFAERRRFIYNTFKFGQQAQQNGEISRQDLEKLTNILKNRLEDVNKQEKDVFRAEADRAAQELVKELEGKVNTENENKTKQAVNEIENLDLEELDGHLESIPSGHIRQPRPVSRPGASGWVRQGSGGIPANRRNSRGTEGQGGQGLRKKKNQTERRSGRRANVSDPRPRRWRRGLDAAMPVSHAGGAGQLRRPPVRGQALPGARPETGPLSADGRMVHHH